MIEKALTAFMPLMANRRDRMIIFFGIVMLIVLGVIIFSGANEAVISARQNLSDKQQLLSWMKANAAAVEKAHAAIQRSSIAASPQNSLGVIDSTIKSFKLDSFLKKSEQLQDQKIQLSFAQVPFDSLIEGLFSLQHKMNFQVIVFSAEDSSGPGSVNAEIVLSLPKIS